MGVSTNIGVRTVCSRLFVGGPHQNRGSLHTNEQSDRRVSSLYARNASIRSICSAGSQWGPWSVPCNTQRVDRSYPLCRPPSQTCAEPADSKESSSAGYKQTAANHEMPLHRQLTLTITSLSGVLMTANDAPVLRYRSAKIGLPSSI